MTYCGHMEIYLSDSFSTMRASQVAPNIQCGHKGCLKTRVQIQILQDSGHQSAYFVVLGLPAFLLACQFQYTLEGAVALG